MWVCYPQTSNPKIGFITNKMHFQQCIAKRQNMKSNKQWISANSHISYLKTEEKKMRHTQTNITQILKVVHSITVCHFKDQEITFQKWYSNSLWHKWFWRYHQKCSEPIFSILQNFAILFWEYNCLQNYKSFFNSSIFLAFGNQKIHSGIISSNFGLPASIQKLKNES